MSSPSSAEHSDPGRHDALQRFMRTAVLLVHRLRAASESIHSDLEISAGQRGILRDLRECGPLTVPELARMRPVSRQHIQTHVDALRDRGLVERVRNPAHRRSWLIRPTDRGERLFLKMLGREAEVLDRLALDCSDDELRLAIETMQKVRAAFARPEWLDELGNPAE